MITSLGISSGLPLRISLSCGELTSSRSRLPALLSDEDLQNARITIPDVLARVESQMDGIIRKDDFYPVPCVLPFSDLVEAYTGRPQVRFTAHQHCGAATYVFVQKEGVVPVNRMVDVESFFESIQHMAGTIRKVGPSTSTRRFSKGSRSLHSSVKKGEQGNTAEFWKMIGKTLIGQNFDALREFHWNALFIGVMHFMENPQLLRRSFYGVFIS